MKQMALVLQGGGALGAFEYGVVAALVERGWQPTAVTGVSIGAINAAAVAGAPGGDICASLHKLWAAITLPEVPWLPASQQGSLSLFGNPNFYKPRTDYFDMLSWTSLCSTLPMYTTLNKHCDFEQINDPAHMRLAVTSTNLQTGGPTTFSNHLAHGAERIVAEGHIAHRTSIDAAHIIASGSLPPGFGATEINGTQFWDGGLFSNTPIDALLNLLEPDEIETLPIFVVDLFPSEGLPLPTNLVEVQTRTIALQYQNRFWAQYGGTEGLQGFIQMLAELERELPQGSALRGRASYQWLMRLRALKNVQVIQAAEPPLTGGADFSPYGVSNAYQAGRDAVEKHFGNAPQGAQEAAAALT
ncbi:MULTISPECIES: patatin-like phospholipase family protein [unclassified Janthinobacterium]|uniref:patatin-like phospholipase family protein n=1 Tax=unclassified Janthinobacterium TaxID=2610881 RepID=UPI00034D0C56|nr:MULTISPECIES: patatin-like phospholipase family protein [unclassified Janthinobacterium]MEC5163197.1 NTE family protein [Janthinobacterium sp. CG_S6]